VALATRLLHWPGGIAWCSKEEARLLLILWPFAAVALVCDVQAAECKDVPEDVCNQLQNHRLLAVNRWDVVRGYRTFFDSPYSQLTETRSAFDYDGLVICGITLPLLQRPLLEQAHQRSLRFVSLRLRLRQRNSFAFLSVINRFLPSPKG
jgi:hypothetical protein